NQIVFCSKLSDNIIYDNLIGNEKSGPISFFENLCILTHVKSTERKHRKILGSRILLHRPLFWHSKWSRFINHPVMVNFIKSEETCKIDVSFVIRILPHLFSIHLQFYIHSKFLSRNPKNKRNEQR
ncbi:hypothetical protein EDEG_04258, partial [Edhazardia aedis USNM 41457]